MRRAIPLLIAIAAAGCSEQAAKFAAPQVEEKPAQPGHEGIRQFAKMGGEAMPGVAGGQAPGAMAPAADNSVARKIVFTGYTDVIVKDFDTASRQVVSLAEASGGYVANFNVDATSGDRRRATFTLRVPAGKFQPTLDALAALGPVITTRTDSQDVTDEFYDLEARLKTKQEEEKALRELLAKSAGKLEDLLAVRRELKAIREEIESMQGRLNKLSKLTELTTINVTLHEQKDYVPPTAPTFGGRLGDTFTNSAQALGQFLKGLTLAVVAVLPWAPLVLLGLAVILLTRRAMHRAGTPVVPAPTPPVAD